MKYCGLLLLTVLLWAGAACGNSAQSGVADSAMLAQCDSIARDSLARVLLADSLRVENFPLDSVPRGDAETRYTRLTDEDFRIVAEELGVEVAVIKAVVEIEAGKTMNGFSAPGVPLINFDQKMYNIYASKAVDKSGAKGEQVPAGLTGYAKREWTQLINARKKNAQGALMGTFWGMFQIGGFNYKLCGCEDVNEFVRIMSDSEFSQLELFAKFITNAGMLNDLKNKNWASFSRKYNGASYARRGYHTRMAAAYNKYKKQENQQ